MNGSVRRTATGAIGAIGAAGVACSAVVVLVVVAALALGACGAETVTHGDAPTSGNAPPDAGSEDSAMPADWIEHANAKFSFRGPAALEESDVRGIDSFVGALRGPTFTVSFDYGWYSDASFGGHAEDPDLERESLSLDGRDATLAHYADPAQDAERPYVCSLYVADVLRTGKGQPGETRLSFVVRYADPGARDRARAMAASIRFAD